MIYFVALVLLAGIVSFLWCAYTALRIGIEWWRKEKLVSCCFVCFAVICAAIPTAAVICLVDIGGGL